MKSLRRAGLTMSAAICSIIITSTGCSDNKVSEPASSLTENPAPAQAIALPSAPAAPRPKRSPETVLAKVDDKEITQADLSREMDKVKMMMKNSGLSADQMENLMPNIEPQIIDGLVTRTMLENECVKKEITVSENELKAEVEQIKSDMPREFSLDKMLKQTGMTYAAFESEVKEQLKLKKLLDIPEPTDEQVQAYYDENKQYFDVPETVRARHILIMVEETDSDEMKAEKKAKIEGLHKELTEGADFAELASENSDCPSKRDGGSLGNVQRGQMVPTFEEATFNLKTGEISEIVETQFGYHIIEAVERNEPKITPLAEAASQIKAAIKQEAFQEKASMLIEDLKQKATITYGDGVEHGGM